MENNEQTKFEGVAMDIYIIAQAIKRRMLMCSIICLAILGIAVVYCIVKPDIYMASCRIIMNPGQIKEYYSLSKENFIATEMNLIKSGHIVEDVYKKFEFYKKKKYSESKDPIGQLGKLITVVRIPKTNLVEIGFKDSNPKVAAQISNYILKLFLEDFQKRAFEIPQKSLRQLESELYNRKKDWAKVIDEFEKFRINNDLYSVETTRNMLVSRMAELDKIYLGSGENIDRVSGKNKFNNYDGEFKTFILSQREETQKELKKVENLSGTYEALKNKVDTYKNAYETVLNRVNQLKILLRSDAGGVIEVVEEARVPQNKYSLQRIKILAVAAFGSGILCFLLCIFLELLDTTVKTRRELEKLTNLPILSQISWPKKNSLEEFKAFISRPDSTGEYFRSVGLTFLMSPHSRDAKILAVTSSTTRVDKSLFAINLAMTFAQFGKQVLVIEADRKCQISTKIVVEECKEKNGWCSIVSRENILERSTVEMNETHKKKRVDILPFGLVSDDENQIEGRGIKNFMNKIADNYDSVIIDAEPVLETAVTKYFVKMNSLKFVLVERLFESKKSEIESTVQELKEIEANFAGVVLLDLK